MILNERDSRHEQVLQVAQQMMTAARTAPKGKGVDIIEVAMVTESNIRILSDTMKQMYEDNGFKFFLRDADNILQAECVVLIGTRSLPQGLDCGHCGYEHCGDRKKGVPCAINSVDVGIAIGDGFNDLSMIQYAGLGIAMANAQEVVKENADFITLSNEEDGVAYAAEKFILS